MKVLHWIGAGFILFALAFALAGYAVGAPARALRANGYTVAATVVNADARHDRTTFAYAAGGEAHETTLNVYSSAFSTGVRIPLYVSADGRPHRNPVGESIASVFNILSMAFAAVGLSLFALSLVCRVRRQAVDVYLDPRSSKRYAVDVESALR